MVSPSSAGMVKSSGPSIVNVLSHVSGSSKQTSSTSNVNVYEPPQSVISTPGIPRTSSNVAGRLDKFDVGVIPPLKPKPALHTRYSARISSNEAHAGTSTSAEHARIGVRSI